MIAPTLALAAGINGSVKATVVVPSGGVRLWLSRYGPSGTVAYVRGVEDRTVEAGTLVLYDYEAPLDVPLSYQALASNLDGSDQASSTIATITLAVPDCDEAWLVDLEQPANSQQVTIERLAQLAYAIPVGVHYVLGRRTPIVASDIANAATFELAFITDTADQRERARAALGDGTPLLLKTSPAQGIGNSYFSVTGWAEQRISGYALRPERRFVCACVEVDRPDPGSTLPAPVGETYGEVTTLFATYTALKAARATYDDLLHTPIVGSAPPPVEAVVAWPPADV